MSVLKSFESAMPFLVEWLQEQASLPIKYRLLVDFLGMSRDDSHVRRVKEELREYGPAREIIKKQNPDGSWGATFRGTITGSKIRESSPYEGIEYQFSRLLEMGFDKSDKPVQKCARLLKAFVTENPRVPLYEARMYKEDNPDAVNWYLRLIRIISAKMLLRAGYNDEEYLRKWLINYTNNLNEYLESERSKYPYSKFKGNYIVDEEIMMPGHHLLELFAYNRWLRDGLLGKLLLVKLSKYLSNFPAPPADCPIKKISSLSWEFPDLYVRAGDYLYRGLGIPTPVTRAELDTRFKNRIPAVLRQLEMRARNGLLSPDDPALLWLLSHQDSRGVIHIMGRLNRMIGRDTYHYFPLQDNVTGQRRDIDTTFRTLLIIHYMNKTPRVKS